MEKPMLNEVKELSYNELVSHFGEETIQDRYKFLYDKMSEYIQARNIEDLVVINEDILQQMVMDYFADIYRLKSFHNIDKVNITKIVAYEVYWLLRRKPIQLINYSNNNSKLTFVNEGFLTTFIAHECLEPRATAPMSSAQEDDFMNYLKHVNYCLKYRYIDKQWLETVLYSLEIGKIISMK